MKTLEFVIPGRLPGLNAMIKWGRWEYYRKKKEKTKEVAKCMYPIKSAEQPFSCPYELDIVWGEPNKRRDRDNVHAGVKFINDALEKANIVENDNQCRRVTHKVCYVDDEPQIEVKLTIQENKNGCDK